MFVAALYLIANGGWIFAKAELAQVLVERSWRSSHGGERHLPWPWADTWPVARLQLAAKDIDLYVLSGAQGNSLAFGPGHDSGSVLPGSKGFSVIGGHRDTHFTFLQQLALDDEMWVSNINGEKVKLRVHEITVIDTCKSDMMIKGNNPENIKVGSTLSTDEFASDRFDFMLSNPPYGKSWASEQKNIYLKLNKNYAEMIARQWHLPLYGSAFIIAVELPSSYLKKFAIESFGLAEHRQYCIPAVELGNVNKQLSSKITVVSGLVHHRVGSAKRLAPLLNMTELKLIA